MTIREAEKGVIPNAAVRLSPQPAQVDCSSASAGQGPIAVVPLLDGERVAGFEIRCGCGAGAVVECVYAPAATEVKAVKAEKDEREEKA